MSRQNKASAWAYLVLIGLFTITVYAFLYFEIEIMMLSLVTMVVNLFVINYIDDE